MKFKIILLNKTANKLLNYNRNKIFINNKMSLIVKDLKKILNQNIYQ